MVKGKNKKQNLTQLLLSIVIILLLNYIGSFVFTRFDLTSEKRYTLSDATKNLLKELDDVVYVKVYLKGDFPAGFDRLQSATQELLDEFRVYADDNIEYEFIDPTAIDDQKQRDAFYKQLYEKGIEPTNLEQKSEDGFSQQIIFPGALLTFKGREVPIKLLDTQVGTSPEMQLNNSAQALEYKFSNAIRTLNAIFKARIAFVDGHGELDSLETTDIHQALEEFYEVERFTLSGKLNQIKAIQEFNALIIAKPDSTFLEQDKFIVDQFIMNGGKVLWLIDPLYTSIDSLSRNRYTFSLPWELNLDDQLFKYGVRINHNLVQDLQSSAIRLNVALMGQPARFQLFPWIFSPLVRSYSKHPIVNNLDLIKFEYCSTIDTVKVKDIKKTVLLTSSRLTKVLPSPVRVFLDQVRIPSDEKQFQKSFQTLAVLLEGNFTSLYSNRIPPEINDIEGFQFKEKSKATRMIVVADGDVIKNNVQRATNKVLPLGYDLHTEQLYANKEFILNCINYLLDDSGLMSVRGRELKLRLLDKQKVKSERMKWQLINTLLPIAFVLLFGFIYFYIRKRKFGS